MSISTWKWLMRGCFFVSAMLLVWILRYLLELFDAFNEAYGYELMFFLNHSLAFFYTFLSPFVLGFMKETNFAFAFPIDLTMVSCLFWFLFVGGCWINLLLQSKRKGQRIKRMMTIFFTAIAIICIGSAFSMHWMMGVFDTKAFASETGPVEVPTDPKRIVVMDESLTGHVLSLGVKPIGVDPEMKNRDMIEEKVGSVFWILGPKMIEEIYPDLIISSGNDKNNEIYAKIAPTVSFTPGKLDYLAQHIAIGQLIGKEKEARAWVAQWQKKTAEARKQIKAKIGENATVVMMKDGTSSTIYGKKQVSSEMIILYQALQLKMPKKVEQEITSSEKLLDDEIQQYAGDYIFLITKQQDDHDNETDLASFRSFTESDEWHRLPAVNNERVYGCKCGIGDDVFDESIELIQSVDPLILEDRFSKIKHWLMNVN